MAKNKQESIIFDPKVSIEFSKLWENENNLIFWYCNHLNEKMSSATHDCTFLVGWLKEASKMLLFFYSSYSRTLPILMSWIYIPGKCFSISELTNLMLQNEASATFEHVICCGLDAIFFTWITPSNFEDT